MSYANDRDVYRSTGAVNWLRLVPAAVGLLLVAAIMAVALCAAFFSGYYWLFITPILASLPVMGMLYVTLKFSHCRNMVIAFLLAAMSYGVLYLGYYHACLVRTVGIWALPHVELLGPYIDFRMQTDEVRDAAKPEKQNNQNVQRRPGATAMNWFGFGMESLGLISFAVGIAFSVTSRAFCNRCRQWKTSRTLVYSPGTGEKIFAAYEAGRLDDVQKLTTASLPPRTSACEMTVEFCPDERSDAGDCPVYFSLRDVPSGGKSGFWERFGGILQNRHGPGLRWFVRQAALRPAEIASLAPIVADLPSVSGTDDLKVELVSPEKTPRKPTQKLATVEAVPSPYGGRVLTRGHIIIGAVIALAPLLGLVGGIGMFAVAAMSEEGLSETAKIIFLVAGFAMLISTAVYFSYFGDFLPSLYLMGICRKEFDGRVDCWFDHRDVDAIAIQVVPRQNWSRLMLENASDVGYLKIDSAQRELVFEGDKERYRIPANSITYCRVEYFAAPGDQTGKQLFYLVVIRAQTTKGPWETAIAHRHVERKRRGVKQRHEEAVALHERIQSIILPTVLRT
jgi:hypothetical protein